MIDKLSFLKKQLNKGVLGVAFTSNHVSLVHCTNLKRGKPRVALAHIEQLKLNDELGLKKLVAQMGLKSYLSNVVLDADQYQVLQVDKPNVPDAEVKGALRWKVKDLIDYSIDDAEVDGIHIPADPASPNRLPFMYAMCAKRSLLSNMCNSLISSGLRIDSVDAHVMAQRNIAALLETDGRALAMISFISRGCLLTFTCNGELYHTRLIELDREFSFDQGGILSTNLDRLALELQRSLDGFDRQFPYLALKRLVVAPFANRTALIQHLSSQFYVPVESFNLEDIVSLPANLDLSSPEKQALLLPALGGALRVEVAE